MKTLNIVIDVQDHRPRPDGAPDTRGLDDQARERYLAAMKDSVQKLREQGIPTLWIAIGDHSRLYPGSEPRDPALLKDLGLTGADPQPGEDIFEKRFMNGFTDIKDILANPELAKYVAGQRDGNDLKDGEIPGVIFGAKTLDERLRELKVEQVTIMGTMAGFCITENTLGAALKGYRVTVLSDLVVGWADDTYQKALWRQDDPAHHVREVKSALDGIACDPASRGYAASDQPAIEQAIKDKIDIRPFADFIARLSASAGLKASGARPGRKPGARAYRALPARTDDAGYKARIEEVRAEYEQVAAGYDSGSRETDWKGPREVASAILDYITPGMRVLDAGTGTGEVMERLRGIPLEQPLHITGLDLSKDMLAVCREKGLANELHEQDLAQRWPVADGSQDLVTSSGVFEYLDDGQVRAFVREAARALKAGGRIALTFRPARNGESPTIQKLHSVERIGKLFQDYGIETRTAQEFDAYRGKKGIVRHVLVTGIREGGAQPPAIHQPRQKGNGPRAARRDGQGGKPQ